MMTENQLIKKYIGTPYVHVGRDINIGLDCLGFVLRFLEDIGQNVAQYDYESYSVTWFLRGENYFITRMPSEYVHHSIPKKYDIVMFKSAKGIANHLGIVLSNQRFIHACRVGTIISRLNDSQWRKKLVGFYRKK